MNPAQPTFQSESGARPDFQSRANGKSRRRSLRLAFLWLVWPAIALLMATHAHFYQSALRATFSDISVSWVDSFRYPLVECLFWALLTPAIWRGSQRWPLVSTGWIKNLGRLVLANAAVELLHALYRTPLQSLVYPREVAIPVPRLLKYYLFGNALNDAWIFWTIVVISQFAASYARQIERERELARAQLQALTAQLQPHFLFNVLNSVSSLMRYDVDAADEMIERLSDLMRTTLNQASPHEAPLRDELAVVGKYIDIERMRFLDRLQFTVHASDEALDAAVPVLLLLPIVENAVRYAVTPRTSGGRVDIEAVRQQDTLTLKVRDDGPGIQNGCRLKEGIGLSNTRTRLDKHYGGLASFDYRNVESRGFEVEFRLPFRAAMEVRDDTGVAG